MTRRSAYPSVDVFEKFLDCSPKGRWGDPRTLDDQIREEAGKAAQNRYSVQFVRRESSADEVKDIKPGETVVDCTAKAKIILLRTKLVLRISSRSKGDDEVSAQFLVIGGKYFLGERL